MVYYSAMILKNITIGRQIIKAELSKLISTEKIEGDTKLKSRCV